MLDVRSLGIKDELSLVDDLAARVPTLIVWGDEDFIIPVQHAIDAHDQIDGSRLEILEGVGHFPHVESPERFAGVLLDFLAESEPGAGPEALGEVIAVESAARHASPASV